MALTREHFIAAQAEILDEIFGLAPGEEEARRTFEQLALETHDAIRTVTPRDYQPFYPYSSFFNFAVYDRRAGSVVSDDIRQRWRAWQAEYLRLVKSHPALELRDAIHDISESHDRSSWPVEALEQKIREWVDAGDPKALPFDDRDDIASPQFYSRLRELRRALQGWLYRDRDTERVVLVRDIRDA